MKLILACLVMLMFPFHAYGAEKTMTGGGMVWPGIPVAPQQASIAFGGSTLNSLNESYYIIFKTGPSITVGTIGVLINSVASFIGTVEFRCETVDTSGVPTGTLCGTDANASFTPSAGWNEGALTTAPTLAADTVFAVGIDITAFTSGSIEVEDSIQSGDMLLSGIIALPYNVVTTTKQDDYPIGGILDSGGTAVAIPGLLPVEDFTNQTWSDSSDPDRRGVRFKIPFPARLAGFVIFGDHEDDWDYELYDSDGTTTLITGSVDASVRPSTNVEWTFITLATPQSLSKDVSYRLVIHPTTTNSRHNLTTMGVNAAKWLDALPGGQDFHYTTVNGAPSVEGDWTNDTTEVPIALRLIFDGFDDGAGGAAGGAGGWGF